MYLFKTFFDCWRFFWRIYISFYELYFISDLVNLSIKWKFCENLFVKLVFCSIDFFYIIVRNVRIFQISYRSSKSCLFTDTPYNIRDKRSDVLYSHSHSLKKIILHLVKIDSLLSSNGQPYLLVNHHPTM